MPTRTSRAALNMAIGLGVQVVLLGLSLVGRTIFVRTLDVEMLGVNALLMSVVTLTTMVEFGLSTSVMYALYGPLNRHEEDRIASVIQYCGRLYRFVALAVLAVGLALTPFLDQFVSTTEPIPHLETYYLLLVGSSALSYLMAHRIVLLMADQRAYTTRLYFLGTEVVRTGLQVGVLLAYESYLGYLVMQAVTKVAYHLMLHRRVGRNYPYIDQRSRLEEAGRREIRTSIKAMLVYRVSGAVLNNTDAVIISAVVGVAALGIYSNYALLIGAVVLLSEMLFRGMSSSVGDLVAGESRQQVRAVFWELSLVTFAVYSVAALVLLSGLDDVVALWLGPEYVVEDWVLWTAIGNFYLVGLLLPVVVYRTGTGMFQDTKYVLIVTAALNVVLSLVLGNRFGVAGVLGATIVARVLSNAWYEPWRLLRKHLDEQPWRYFGWQLLCLLLVLVQAVAYEALPFGRLGMTHWATLLLQAAVVAVLASTIVLLFFWRTRSMRSVILRARSVVRR